MSHLTGDLMGADFWNEVRQAKLRGQREGQAVFNTACEFYGQYASNLTGTSCDPFYRDENIGAFLEKVVEMATRPNK